MLRTSIKAKPKLALQEKLLISGEDAIPSGHKVVKVTFVDTDGSPKHGFKKESDNNYYPTLNYYPDLLGKYSVAFSVFVRLSLGKKAAEDRLVYNEEGKMTGTVSIEVPNFIPLLTKTEKDHSNAEKNKLAIPNKAMLLKKKVARLLVSQYKHKNNDLHPKNISVNGLIDWDELYYELTSIIKGERYLSGILFESPKETGHLKLEDLKSFPNVSARVHWPANPSPKNLVRSKAYKTNAFQELENDDGFKRQFYNGLLRELLCFDKAVLTDRLKLSLGDERLDLDALPEPKRNALLEFGKPRHLFYDEQGNERTFVDHCATFFEQEHLKFKQIVLNMKEFRDYMLTANNQPKIFERIKKSFLKQNKYNEVPHDLKHADIELHSIWRACIKSKIDEKMHALKSTIMAHRGVSSSRLSVKEHKSVTLAQLDAIMATSLVTKTQTRSDVPVIVHSDAEPKDIAALRNILHAKIRSQAMSLTEVLLKHINEYYMKENATISDNHALIENIKTILITNEKERNQLKEWFKRHKAEAGHNASMSVLLDELIFDINSLFDDIDKFVNEFQETLITIRLNSSISTPTESPSAISSETRELPSTASSATGCQLRLFRPSRVLDNKPDLSYDSEDTDSDSECVINDKTNIDQLSKLLSFWLKPDKQSFIRKIAHDVYLKDYYGFFYSFSRRRKEDICDKPLHEIFSDGSWESTSLNTLIVKRLCLTMLKEDLTDPFKKLIYDRIVANTDEWWSNIAYEIAKKSVLKDHTTAASSLKSAYR